MPNNMMDEIKTEKETLNELKSRLESINQRKASIKTREDENRRAYNKYQEDYKEIIEGTSTNPMKMRQQKQEESRLNTERENIRGEKQGIESEEKELQQAFMTYADSLREPIKKSKEIIKMAMSRDIGEDTIAKIEEEKEKLQKEKQEKLKELSILEQEGKKKNYVVYIKEGVIPELDEQLENLNKEILVIQDIDKFSQFYDDLESIEGILNNKHMINNKIQELSDQIEKMYPKEVEQEVVRKDNEGTIESGIEGIKTDGESTATDVDNRDIKPIEEKAIEQERKQPERHPDEYSEPQFFVEEEETSIDDYTWDYLNEEKSQEKLSEESTKLEKMYAVEVRKYLSDIIKGVEKVNSKKYKIISDEPLGWPEIGENLITTLNSWAAKHINENMEEKFKDLSDTKKKSIGNNEVKEFLKEKIKELDNKYAVAEQPETSQQSQGSTNPNDDNLKGQVRKLNPEEYKRKDRPEEQNLTGGTEKTDDKQLLTEYENEVKDLLSGTIKEVIKIDDNLFFAVNFANAVLEGYTYENLKDNLSSDVNVGMTNYNKFENLDDEKTHEIVKKAVKEIIDKKLKESQQSETEFSQLLKEYVNKVRQFLLKTVKEVKKEDNNLFKVVNFKDKMLMSGTYNELLDELTLHINSKIADNDNSDLSYRTMHGVDEAIAKEFLDAKMQKLEKTQQPETATNPGAIPGAKEGTIINPDVLSRGRGNRKPR